MTLLLPGHFKLSQCFLGSLCVFGLKNLSKNRNKNKKAKSKWNWRKQKSKERKIFFFFLDFCFSFWSYLILRISCTYLMNFWLHENDLNGMKSLMYQPSTLIFAFSDALNVDRRLFSATNKILKKEKKRKKKRSKEVKNILEKRTRRENKVKNGRGRRRAKFWCSSDHDRFVMINSTLKAFCINLHETSSLSSSSTSLSFSFSFSLN